MDHWEGRVRRGEAGPKEAKWQGLCYEVLDQERDVKELIIGSCSRQAGYPSGSGQPLGGQALHHFLRPRLLVHAHGVLARRRSYGHAYQVRNLL